MKRFYKLVTTAQNEAGEHEIHLDGRPVKTTGRAVLAAPSKSLAEAVMGEWAAQDEEINPQDMPLTQILSTKIDYAAPRRNEIAAKVIKYLDTDLLCYHADGQVDEVRDIARLQGEVWSPWLDWFEGRFGISLQNTTALTALRQDDAARKASEDYISALDDDRFMVLQMVTHETGSLVLGLAMLDSAADAEQVFTAACLEELHQEGLYDPEGTYGPDPYLDKKHTQLKTDLHAARRYLDLIADE